MGNKYNITPVRREFLSDLRAVVALDGSSLESAVVNGLNRSSDPNRYGIPFLGDNAFLIDRLLALSWPPREYDRICWYERVGSEANKAKPRASRLTVLIDRADLSKTVSDLYAPMTTPISSSDEIPDSAWTVIDPQADGRPQTKSRKG
jgi:CRISPR-associated protein Cas5t